jgi:3-(3-hydroxy-phenyl)propionate hydroxylase
VSTYDVAIVGFGPVGATLAGLCARRGLSVVVFDKDVDVYPLPRAAHVTDEVMRVWQELGCADEMFAGMRENVGMDLLTARGEVLHSMRSPGITRCGWPGSLFFHQPSTERALRKAVLDLGITAHLGTEVLDIEARADEIVVTTPSGDVCASWLVGCDGARSFVRKAFDIALDDLQFEEPWIVVDLVCTGPTPKLPDRALQICDPARPHTLVPMPEPRFRFEFMLLPGEDADAMQAPDVVRTLMAPWVGADTIEVERSAVYTFHGLIAREWRRGRVLLAGDAAHQMPPFLGQGMCSGIRDAANLAWKLAAVHCNDAPDALLDTYQAEREPHVRQIAELAIGAGRMICTTDARIADERDRAMAQTRHENDGDAKTFELPQLPAGPLVLAGGGRLAPQPLCDGTRLDELIGPRFGVVVRDYAQLPSTATEFWARRATLVDAVTYPILDRLLDDLDTEVVVIRPDRYVLATGDSLDAITDRIRPLLQRKAQ